MSALTPATPASSDDRPIMIFDAECRFCRRWIARWRRRTKGRVAYVSYQRLGARYPEVSRQACAQAIQLLERTGRIFSGADAIVRLFDYGLPGGRIGHALCAHPPIIWILRAGYRVVARHRAFFSRLFRARR
jgi:lipase maturation factor 1